MSKQINKTRNTVQQPGAKHGHTLALGPDTWRDSPTGRFRMGKLRGRRSRRLPRAEQGGRRGLSPHRLTRPAAWGASALSCPDGSWSAWQKQQLFFTARRRARASRAAFTPNTPGRKKTPLFKTNRNPPPSSVRVPGPVQAAAASPGVELSLRAVCSCRSATMTDRPWSGQLGLLRHQHLRDAPAAPH